MYNAFEFVSRNWFCPQMGQSLWITYIYMFISHWSLFMCTKHVAVYFWHWNMCVQSMQSFDISFICICYIFQTWFIYLLLFLRILKMIYSFKTVCLWNVEYYFIFFFKQFFGCKEHICFLSMLLLKFWLRVWVWNYNLLIVRIL